MSVQETQQQQSSEDASAEGGAPQDGQQQSGADQTKTFTQADLDRVVEQRLSRERAKFSDYDDLKAAAGELTKIREGEKTELQREREAREAAEKRAETAEFSALRSKVASTKGVPAASLTGKTEDELNAAADELITWRDQAAAAAPPKPPAPKRNPASDGTFKSGATGGGGTNPDPKERAAEALRQLSSSHD